MTLDESFEKMQRKAFRNPECPEIVRWLKDIRNSSVAMSGTALALGVAGVEPPENPDDEQDIIDVMLSILAISFEAGRMHRQSEREYKGK